MLDEKVIRDPVYGYIRLTSEQCELIKLPVFQRLRRISQLSFADLVYPNATHNRFSHCLGVMHLGRIVSNYLKTSGIGEEIGLEDIDYKSIVWAGLLHDIGHLPFSHVCEPAFAYFMDELTDWKDYHVKLGSEIIQNPEFGIEAVIGEEIAEKVTALISDTNSNTYPLVQKVMTGICSIDRLDYLKRDAHHAGTPEYAIIDMERILTSIISFGEDVDISPLFKKKAMYALEGVVLSYFYMYRAIYYHHAVRAAYLLFQDIIWDAFDNPDYNLKGEIENLRDPNFWCHFDDHRFLSLLYSIKGLHSKLEQLVFRKLPKAVPLEKIGDHNITRIAKLIGNHSYKDKVYMEREITKKLKDRYPELERILLDSTIVSPYPPSFRSGKLIYIWDEKMNNSEPVNLASQATYLKVLEDTSENERAAAIYVYPKSFRENSKFMDDLKLTCREELRSISL